MNYKHILMTMGYKRILIIVIPTIIMAWAGWYVGPYAARGLPTNAITTQAVLVALAILCGLAADPQDGYREDGYA